MSVTGDQNPRASNGVPARPEVLSPSRLVRKILVPTDPGHLPIEVFELVNDLAQGTWVTAILLRVITLNIVAAENRVFEELGREAYCQLQELARQHLRPGIPILLRVRLGDPVKEILAQARADHADLIVLPGFAQPAGKSYGFLWRRQPAATLSSLASRITCQAPCDVMVVPTSANRKAYA
jgi:nucleotide-binding universal stress UspA family protein